MQVQPGLSAWCIGTAGEYLVCADLALRGFVPTLAPGGAPYDVLVDFGGRVARVQVKASTEPRYVPLEGVERKNRRLTSEGRGPRYQFAVARNTVEKRQETDPVDLFAFVAIDLFSVCYRTPGEVYSGASGGGACYCLHSSDFCGDGEDALGRRKLP